jgi:hypothetical protein
LISTPHGGRSATTVAARTAGFKLRGRRCRGRHAVRSLVCAPDSPGSVRLRSAQWPPFWSVLAT